MFICLVIVSILNVARVKFCKVFNLFRRIIPKCHVAESRAVPFEKL